MAGLGMDDETFWVKGIAQFTGGIRGDTVQGSRDSSLKITVLRILKPLIAPVAGRSSGGSAAPGFRS
jgi:hypothetical protein